MSRTFFIIVFTTFWKATTRTNCLGIFFLWQKSKNENFNVVLCAISYIILYFDATFSMLNNLPKTTWNRKNCRWWCKITFMRNSPPFSVRHSRIAKRANFLCNISIVKSILKCKFKNRCFDSSAQNWHVFLFYVKIGSRLTIK